MRLTTSAGSRICCKTSTPPAPRLVRLKAWPSVSLARRSVNRPSAVVAESELADHEESKVGLSTTSSTPQQDPYRIPVGRLQQVDVKAKMLELLQGPAGYCWVKLVDLQIIPGVIRKMAEVSDQLRVESGRQMQVLIKRQRRREPGPPTDFPSIIAEVSIRENVKPGQAPGQGSLHVLSLATLPAAASQPQAAAPCVRRNKLPALTLMMLSLHDGAVSHALWWRTSPSRP
ncbi:hypothetical protein V8C86DRAFT_646617 [Haematococcus lacustris]